MGNQKKVHELTKKIEIAKLKQNLAKLRTELKALKAAKAPKLKIQEKELEIQETIGEIGKKRSLKLEREESKKNKSKKGSFKKKLFTTIIVGGIVVFVVVASFSRADREKKFGEFLQNSESYISQILDERQQGRPADEAREAADSTVTYNTPYTLCITYEHPEFTDSLYHMNNDFKYFHVLSQGGTNRLVVTRSDDTSVRDAITRQVLNGITSDNPNLIPLAQSGLIGDIVENGNTEMVDDNYIVTIDRTVLDGLLQGENVNQVTYADEAELNELLDGSMGRGR